MIKAILFDMDGVLVDSLEANMQHKKALFKKAGYNDIDDVIADSFHKPIKQVIEELLKAKGKHTEHEITRMHDLLMDPSLREFQANNFKFPKDLEKILKRLHSQFILGVVTSRMRVGVDEVFGLRPIKKYFDVVISVDDVVNHKPHPEPLEKALKKLKLEPNEAIYIGDSDTDILAADAAGMPSIHLSEIMHELAHRQIRDFSQIPDAIKLIIENHAYDNS